jgi:hypothetical protein
MSSAIKHEGRRSLALATVVGSVLASYAGTAGAIEFELDNGVRINWNTTLSVGASWRAEEPSRLLYTNADGSLIGLTGGPRAAGSPMNPNDGLGGSGNADSGNLNYDDGDRFSTPFKIISDVEVKKGDFGGLVRIKAWYDQALNENDVRIGNQANAYNGVRPGYGPVSPPFGPCTSVAPGTPPCLPVNGKWPNEPLSDRGFEDEQKFDNLMLLDAYVYGTFALGNTDLQLRVGRQVVNWGESIFIQGVNQINPLDVPAARRPGSELKEILLPVGMVYANWGFSLGSVEAFYQWEWDNTSIDSCGTYWSVTEGIISADPGQCLSATVITSPAGGAAPGTASPIIPQLGSNPFAVANGLYVPLVKGREADDQGQFGIAFRFPVEALDTEFGLYAMNIHSRIPVVSGYTGTAVKDIPEPYRTVLTRAGAIGFDNGPDGRHPGTQFYRASATSVTRQLTPAQAAGLKAATGGAVDFKPFVGFWEYPEDIQIYGLSAATNLFGWSVSAEASYQKDVPVQVNGNDNLQAALSLLGPRGENGYDFINESAGTYSAGYRAFDKTQFQVNTVKTFSNLMGADNSILVAEVGFQWNDVPDYQEGEERFGRGFIFGVGSNTDLAAQVPLTGGNTCSPTAVGAPFPVASPVFNPQPNGCKNDGYVSDFSWGYRIRWQMEFNNVADSGIGVLPSVYWAHDVDGVSMDPAFVEDRKQLGLGLKFTYNKKYNLDFNWVEYANADYDPLGDRDFYSISASMTF